MADVCYIRQKEQTGGGNAILCAEKHIGDEPFAVLLGDTITKSEMPRTKQLIDIFNIYRKSTISIKVISNDKQNKYALLVEIMLNKIFTRSIN